MPKRLSYAVESCFSDLGERGRVTVAAGDSVTWTNNDAVTHQVVGNDGYHDGLRPALKGSVTPPFSVG